MQLPHFKIPFHSSVKWKLCIILSFKKMLFQRSIKYTPTLTTQLQPAETLHLPCDNRHHQTELMKNFLSLASHKQIQRCGPTIHTFTHLSILMYRDLSLKDSDSFLDFRLDLYVCNYPCNELKSTETFQKQWMGNWIFSFFKETS